MSGLAQEHLILGSKLIFYLYTDLKSIFDKYFFWPWLGEIDGNKFLQHVFLSNKNISFLKRWGFSYS